MRELPNEEWWVYKSALLEDTRASHAAHHNHAYKRDDPFWQSWYPPNAWNCKCRVIAMTEGQLQRAGITKIDTPFTPNSDQDWGYDVASGANYAVEENYYQKAILDTNGKDDNISEIVRETYKNNMRELLPSKEEVSAFVDRALSKNNSENLRVGYLTLIESEGLQKHLLERQPKSDLVVASTGKIRNLRTHIESGKSVLSVEEIKDVLSRIQKPDEVYLDEKPENVLLVWNSGADKNRIIVQLDYKKNKDIYNAIRTGQKFSESNYASYIHGKKRL